jgi:GntR family transcriptional regulator
VTGTNDTIINSICQYIELIYHISLYFSKYCDIVLNTLIQYFKNMVNMETQIIDEEKDNPFYIQLKNVIKKQIQEGNVKAGKIEPVRKVAKKFDCSINTVVKAYNELRKEGIITSKVGRGTYITSNFTDLKKQNKEFQLKKIFEHALEEAISLEYTIEEFHEFIEKYIKEKLEMISKIHLAFIECNVEQLNYFTDHLELDPKIIRSPILLQDLYEQKKSIIQKLESADIFVTSFYHVDEVTKYLDYLKKPIIAINLEPVISTIIEIAKIPPNSKVSIITISERFKKEIKNVIEKNGFEFSKIYETHSKNKESIKQMVKKSDAVLVSPGRRSIVEEYVKENTKIIEFMFTPDRTSINNIKVAIIELKKSLI